MKHAKKLLAVVMVLAMVAAFSAVAFAADPSVALKVSDYEDGAVTVTAYFTNCVGLTSGSIQLGYPDGKDVTIEIEDGDDVADAKTLKNAFTYEFNDESNPTDCGFYFKENLYSKEDWAKIAADKGKSIDIDGSNFNFAVFTVTAPKGTVINVTGELKIGDKATAIKDSFTVGGGSEPVSTTKAPDPVSTTKAPDPVSTTKAPDPVSTTKAPDPVSTTKAPAPVSTTKAPAPVDSSKYDKYGNKIIGYDKNGQAIIGYTNGQAIYSPDKSAHKGVILDVDPNNNGHDFVGGKTDSKADDKCTTAKTCKTAAGVKTDGGKKTGDNSVLAIMAGVVALAGAAFVVTKKRK